MKIVIPGGTGQLGAALAHTFSERGDEVVILSRGASAEKADAKNKTRHVAWDGKSKGAWWSEIDGADVVINLAGRTVSCRYTEENLRQMMDSRVDSTRIVGEAISSAKKPPRVWLQMSTATIYAHRFDAPNDEKTGVIGGDEPDVPAYWKRSIDIAVNWERALSEADVPQTRRVAMRSSMVMGPAPGGIFDVLCGLARARLGGVVGSGKQWVSWIHERDFIASVDFLIAHDDIDGAINLCGPNPLPQREFMRGLREALGVGIGLPATKWMAEIGAFFLRTDTELLLKSRRVVPTRLLDLGFTFTLPTWKEAAAELVKARAQGLSEKAPV